MMMIPVVVVLGATGTGKSKLAIELCKSLGGEVVNADAVQCYQGLPIMTNKATAEETAAVPHHLLGFVDPVTQRPLGQSPLLTPAGTQLFDVREWVKLADSAVEDIHKRRKIPVVVGGTHYYIESLIWRKLIDQESNSELYEMLRKVDPITAERLHPNNRRKVIRSLTIFHTTNKPQSEIIREASALPAPSETGKDEGTKSSIQRYNPFFIWVDTASLEQLDPKLDARVDEMVDRGLLNEVAELKSKVTAVSSSSSSAAAQTNVSFERGIFQSIGLRQFWDVTAEDAAQKNKKYTDALESMKACTRRYARQQHRWIKNRLEKAGIPLLRLVVAMDGSSSWKDSVLGPALRETKSFLEDAKTPGKVFPPLPCPLSTVGTEWKKYNCDVCRCQLNGENEWTAHLKSKKHKHFLKLERKRKRSAADEGDENGEESIKRPAREEKI